MTSAAITKMDTKNRNDGSEMALAVSERYDANTPIAHKMAAAAILAIGIVVYGVGLMLVPLLILLGRVKGPNDPKLSDGGAWRGSCVVERRTDIRATAKGGSDETGPS